jgi:Ca-activated chloride channel family protein
MADPPAVETRFMSLCPSIRRRPALAAVIALALALALSLLAPVLMPVASWAAAGDAGRLLFILDASASMATKAQGKPRMEIARTVLSDLIADLPAGIEVGLLAYGHRKKDDCRDVEQLVALGPLDRKALTEKLSNLTPRGKAPLAGALRAAAEGLREHAGETTIVLVSDSAERCGGDPCALVKELKASGLRFTLQVVGFGVAAKERTRLECIAAAGGGAYFPAKNAADLAGAIRKAVAPTAEAVGRLTVRALRDGQPLGAWYDLYAGETPRGPGQPPLASHPIADQGEVIRLVPGTYDLVVREREETATPTLTFTGLRVAAGETIEQVADFSGGDLMVKALRNRRPFNAWYQVLRAGEATAGTDEPVASGPIGIEGATIELLPGTYDLVIQNQEDLGQPVRRFTDIPIEAGKSVQKTGEFAGGTLRVIARKGGLPVKARFEISSPGAAGAEPPRIGADSIADAGERIGLPPGTYDLRIRNVEDPGDAVIDFPGVVVEAARTVERRADF